MTTNKDFWDNTLAHCSKEDKNYIASIVLDEALEVIKQSIEERKKPKYIPKDSNYWSYYHALDEAISLVDRFKQYGF